jgi:ubiquitin-conjugating enzyme E2 W
MITKRLQKEAKAIYEQHQGLLELNIIDESKNIWHIKFQGAADTLYTGETFTLHFRFDDKYPFEAPEVKFVG